MTPTLARRWPVLAGALGAMLLATAARPEATRAPLALVVDIEGAIGPATAELVTDALETAAARRARVVVLRLDTPGGLLTSTRELVRAIVASPVPVAVHVAPAGAHAASAGTFLVQAAHVAAMAPGTNLGAATPITLGVDPKDASAAERKALEDAAASLRSLAELRGRSAEWAEQAVREGSSLTARAALERGVIDLVVPDIAGLLAASDGRVVSVGGRAVRLETAGLALEVLEPSWSSRFLQAITDPNVALLLVVVGALGIAAEVAIPGAIGPGALGAVALLLGLYGLNLLAVDWAGLLLLLLGLVLMIAEAFTPTFGVLGAGGVAALVAGALLLFRGVPGVEVGGWAIGVAALASAGFLLWIARHLWRARRTPSVTGAEGLAGARGRVLDWEGDGGHVHVQGERWRAIGPPGLLVGDPVVVREVRDLTLRVVAAATETVTASPYPERRHAAGGPP